MSTNIIKANNQIPEKEMTVLEAFGIMREICLSTRNCTDCILVKSSDHCVPRYFDSPALINQLKNYKEGRTNGKAKVK
ncbi:MAG: hypothetical protein RR012_01330 [Oscillospiraceae bacterium]